MEKQAFFWGTSTMPKAKSKAKPAGATSSSTLVLGTRGLRARHRHLLRDLLRLMPHGKVGSKLSVDDDGLEGVVPLCEDANCDRALLLDARDSRRLYMWVAGCPDGPSAMFRVLNVHTVAELKFDVRSSAGARSLLCFDHGFEECAERRVLKALITQTFGVPRGTRSARGGALVERVRHTLSFSWLDGRVWLRVYRMGIGLNGENDLVEIGPRLVLQPVRVIASGFSGAILSTHEHGATNVAGDEDPE